MNPGQTLIEIFNSSAYVSIRKEVKKGGLMDSDKGFAETAYVNEKTDKIIVLNGDHGDAIRLLCSVHRFPHDHILQWFETMHKEWSSSWDEKSSVESWNFERDFVTDSNP